MKKRNKQMISFGCACLISISLYLPVSAAQNDTDSGNKNIVKIKTGSTIHSLSPQPEPPDKTRKWIRALGPQPEPPDKTGKGKDALGPQPEPPGKGAAALGPQPEPPGRNSATP